MRNLRLLNELQSRTGNKPADSIEFKLMSFAADIIKQCNEHQKRVLQILPEFDLHDQSHLEAVSENIASLMGEKILHNLSTFEIFILLCASYLHDCGMAPAEWELRLMALTEGTDRWFENIESIKNDGKIPFCFADAITFIKSNKKIIYGTYEGDVAKWAFSAKNEEKFISQMAELLVSYQDYRNGFVEKLQDCISVEEFRALNKKIRMDYIRVNHPQKAYDYITNTSDLFVSSLGFKWAKSLCYDIANVCLAHGRDLSFVRTLPSETCYYRNESCNLQFAAMMLRLSDLIHFNAGRAPLIIREAKIFESSYSYNQWKVKSMGLECSVSQGLICFSAFCDDPECYYQLQSYCDYVDEEINNYYRLVPLWQLKYNFQIHSVDRSNIKADREEFIPAIGKMFSLQQNRIVELLMGVGLYKEPFACLRELYQNALDACRCRIGLSHKEDVSYKPLIEFGLGQDLSGKYLYCKDNGIGMTQSVIETYLLRIGNSFYNSEEFYRMQSTWNTSIKPISQFGIGILSTFMIGDRIEILTCSYNTRKTLACCINGPHEYMYYRKIGRLEAEAFTLSGTIVKVYLKSDYQNRLNNEPIDNLALNVFSSYSPYYFTECTATEVSQKWSTSLYKVLIDYIHCLMDGIAVRVNFADGSNMAIRNKPYSLTSLSSLCSTNFDSFNMMSNLNIDFKELLENYIMYEICVEHDGVSLNSILYLPKYNSSCTINVVKANYFLVTADTALALDGVAVDSNNSESNLSFEILRRLGIINFWGVNKPKITIDRNSIVSYPQGINEVYRILFLKLMKRYIDVVKEHIADKENKWKQDVVDSIWQYVFSLFVKLKLYANELAKTEYGDIVWTPLCQLFGQKLTIREFMNLDYFEIKNYDYSLMDEMTSQLVLAKLYTSNEVIREDRSIKVNCRGQIPFCPESDCYCSMYEYLLPLEDKFFGEYDLISNFYPMVPQRVISYLRSDESGEHGFNNIEKISIQGKKAFKVAKKTLFLDLFNQDWRMVNPHSGLYKETGFGDTRTINCIGRFDLQRGNIGTYDEKFLNGKKDTTVTRKMIMAFIAPRQLLDDEIVDLRKYKESDPEYYKGMLEGWTILVTGMDTDNIIISTGHKTRKQMLCLLGDEFWGKYPQYKFSFLDGEIISMS